MPIADPAQLLQRVPELRALIDDPKIRHAIESGDPFKTFRALMLARLLRRLPAHRDLLKSLTGERRLFAKPLKGTPSLGSINSVGFSFVGKAEENSDGSYIALHAFVVLFALPLMPLGAYVVKSTGARQWQIYARAPLGIAGWLYTRGLALALVLLVGSGAAHSFHASNSQDLTLLNGFDVPLTVAFENKVVDVPAQGRATINLKAGRVHGRASAAVGGLIDSLDEDLPSSARTSMWNIAGAAPLLRDTVVYRKYAPSGADEKPNQTVYCGKRFLQLDNIQYAFVEPPRSISMGSQQDITVEHLAVVTRPHTAGVTMCVDYAMNQGREGDAAPALEALARINHWSLGYAGGAIFAARAISPEQAIRVARLAIAHNPADVTLQRQLQDFRDDAGQHEAQLREHAARARAQPDSPLEQYLYASLLSGTAGVDAMRDLVNKFPQDPTVLRSLVWREAAHGDYAGAQRDLARLHQLSPPEAARIRDVEVRLLMALHQGADAMKLLDAAVQDKTAVERGVSATEFALVARQRGADPERYLHSYPGDDGNPAMLDLLRVRAGLAPLREDSAANAQIKLVLALRKAPAEALRLGNDMSRSQLGALAGDQLMLLYCEAVRTGQTALVAKLGMVMQVSQLDGALLRPFLLGENSSLSEVDLDLDMRAAAYFIRSRNANLPAAERDALRERAGNSDFLHGVISAALTQWPG